MAVSAEHLVENISPYTCLDCLLIGGSWRQGRSSKRIRDRDPYKGYTLLELASASEQDLNEAYAAAAAAQPKWAGKAFTTDQWLTVQHQPRVFPKRAGEVSGAVSAGG